MSDAAKIDVIPDPSFFRRFALGSPGRPDGFGEGRTPHDLPEMTAFRILVLNGAAEARVAEFDPVVPPKHAQALPHGSQDALDLLVLHSDLVEESLELPSHRVEALGESLEFPAPPCRDRDL